ncbi:Hypothetical protein AA314_00322 [Archangium gephyra]|uniref:Uncharacterized protein n=1 Tax=Archangium gephyra TaxID=48 RepID=A0AAC8TBR6_9BACT|nr:Hypothetical protein AA314_00322 [Archangium gephyra]
MHECPSDHGATPFSREWTGSTPPKPTPKSGPHPTPARPTRPDLLLADISRSGKAVSYFQNPRNRSRRNCLRGSNFLR